MRKKIVLTTPYPTPKEIAKTYGMTKAEIKRVDEAFEHIVNSGEFARAIKDIRPKRRSSVAMPAARAKRVSTHARKKTA